MQAPCKHFYDRECITELYQAATKVESLFPPRCCRVEIPFSSVSPYLSAALASLFEEKSREFSTPKRVYCASPTCSRFLGPQQEGGNATTVGCPAAGCVTRTCTGCSARVESRLGWHACGTDPADEAVLALGRALAWARCPGCGRMVELDTGCFHVTCVCRTQVRSPGFFSLYPRGQRH